MNNYLLKCVSLEEVECIIFQMKKGKAPSLDGFLIEFFQEFWDILKFDSLEVVRECHNNK